jgi:hypothetical protein
LFFVRSVFKNNSVSAFRKRIDCRVSIFIKNYFVLICLGVLYCLFALNFFFFLVQLGFELCLALSKAGPLSLEPHPQPFLP